MARLAFGMVKGASRAPPSLTAAHDHGALDLWIGDNAGENQKAGSVVSDPAKSEVRS
jgi:hypothetical protein